MYGESVKRVGLQLQGTDRIQYILEQPHVTAQRHSCSQHIRKLRQNNKYNIVYTDKTWVNRHRTNDYIWLDKDCTGDWRVPNVKRTRLILCIQVEFKDGMMVQIWCFFKDELS